MQEPFLPTVSEIQEMDAEATTARPAMGKPVTL